MLTVVVQVQYVDVVRDMVRELRRQQSAGAAAANTTATTTNSQFSWFWRQREKHFSRLLWPHQDVCSRAASATDQPLSPAAAADLAAAVRTTAAEGFWGVTKFDCSRCRSWTVAFSVPFFGCTSRRKLAFK